MLKASIKAAIFASAVIATSSMANAADDPFKGKFNHYQCYDVRKWDGKIDPQDVTVRDQFGKYGQFVVEPVMLCNPVDIMGMGIPNPEVHLTCYRTDPNNDGDLKPQDVVVNNKLGEQKLRLRRVSQLLCVTSTKKHLK